LYKRSSQQDSQHTPESIRGRHSFIVILLLCCLAVSVKAQESPCGNATAASVVSRPAIASATDVTQCGVAELEYGVERQWVGASSQRTDFSGGVRFGLAPNLDFHWFAGNFLSVTDTAGNRTGYGDNWLGLKYRFLPQTKRRPSFGLLYQVKAPTGDLLLGSTGKVDHQFAALLSKDIKKFHFDFNVIPQLIGRTGASGFDHNVGYAWATWLPVTKRLTLVMEPYGFTSLNDTTPGFASAMAGFSFRAHRQVYLDTGFDAGISHFAPHKRVYVGVTYAIGNIYSWIRPSQSTGVSNKEVSQKPKSSTAMPEPETRQPETTVGSPLINTGSVESSGLTESTRNEWVPVEKQKQVTSKEPDIQKTEASEIEDNSFLIEEAYNQEFGVVQHISTFTRFWNSKDWIYTFTQEWPAPGDPRHQLSYTVAALQPGAYASAGPGSGDVALNYRYQLLGNGETRIAFSPRLTLLLPLGDPSFGRGSGGTGIQTNLPLSVKLDRRFVTHWNAGATAVPHANNAAGDRGSAIGYNLGSSVIWLVHPRFNVMLEGLFNSAEQIVARDKTEWSNSLYLSPGIRWAHNFKNGLQIVPGIAAPIGAGPSTGEKGVFLYLSFEHPFRKLHE